jgi:general secretion pathway protein H
MPTSAAGNSHAPGVARPRLGGSRGFTLIELLIVLALLAVAAGVMSLALRDGNEARLEEEGARLTALLEMARAEARVAGATVRWQPYGPETGSAVQFRFVGLPLSQNMPTRWLDAGTTAVVVGAPTVLLGPEAILPPQRIVLRLADHRLELATDGLGPFAVAGSGAAEAAR